ncbi:hypothetical protein ACSSS7_003568 [Eimeria intestinalis]
MGEVAERRARAQESLLSRIQDQAGKSLEEIETDWTAQLQLRHKTLKELQDERITTAAGFFERAAEKSPDKVFLVYGGNVEDDEDSSDNACEQCIKRELTYEHVDRASNAVACWALKLQEEIEGKRPDNIACAEHDSSVTCSRCAPHSRVAALMMRSSPECLILFLGLVKAGMTVAMLHPRLHGVLLRRALEEAGAKTLICDGLTVKAVRETWGKHLGDVVMEGLPAATQEKQENGSYPVSTFICGRAGIFEKAGEFSLFTHMGQAHQSSGPNFRLDGEAAPRVELAAFLEQVGGVFGARVEALHVFSRRIEVEGAAGDAASKGSDVKEASSKWPGSIVELLREGAAQHHLKCLVACVHAKSGEGDSSKKGDEAGKLPPCGPFDLDSSLLVVREKKSGWSAKAMLGGGGGVQETEVSVQAFLRKLRHALDCGVPMAMRPVVLMLCLGCGSSATNSDRRGSTGSTCSSCRSEIGEETATMCSCGCRVACHCCRSHPQSIEALCDLVDGNGCGTGKCGSPGSACKEGTCRRCCFLFYADVNGDAFVPLNKQTFNDFVQENYAEFGL